MLARSAPRILSLLASSLLATSATAQVPPKGYSAVGFNILSGYDWEMPDPLDPSAKPPQNVIPASIKALDGKSVVLKGFMLPLDLDVNGVSKFMLNANLDMCYFGAPVRLNDWVMITMKTPNQIGSKPRPVTIGKNTGMVSSTIDSSSMIVPSST